MKKVCIVVASRANYGRIKYLMKAIQDSPELELQIIVGASLLIERFGKAVNILNQMALFQINQYFIMLKERIFSLKQSQQD